MKQFNFSSQAGRRLVAFVLALGLVTGVGLIHAAPVEVPVNPFLPNAPDTSVIADWSDAVDNDTGVRLKILEGNGGKLSIELLDNPYLNLPTPEGFQLLDTTLFVKPTLAADGRRMRIRMDYGRYGGRMGLRDIGIRANTIRILRADLTGGRWIRAIDGIRANVGIRYLREKGPNFTLGFHGFDRQNEFAWAVLDTQGEQYYALGGLTNVPLPAAWLLFITGSGLLLMVSRKTSKSGS